MYLNSLDTTSSSDGLVIALNIKAILYRSFENRCNCSQLNTY